MPDDVNGLVAYRNPDGSFGEAKPLYCPPPPVADCDKDLPTAFEQAMDDFARYICRRYRKEVLHDR